MRYKSVGGQLVLTEEARKEIDTPLRKDSAPARTAEDDKLLLENGYVQCPGCMHVFLPPPPKEKSEDEELVGHPVTAFTISQKRKILKLAAGKRGLRLAPVLEMNHISHQRLNAWRRSEEAGTLKADEGAEL